MSNIAVTEKYPFLQDSDPNTYLEENETWVDQLPEGWRGGFLVLCEAIKNTLAAHQFDIGHFGFGQVKEKYGYARLYWDLKVDYGHERYGAANKELSELISEFENATRAMCCECGGAATFTSRGYILPYCRKCSDGWLVRYREIRKDNKNAKHTDHFRKETFNA